MSALNGDKSKVEISPRTQPPDGSAAANPQTAEGVGGGVQIGASFKPRQAPAGVGLNAPVLAPSPIPGAIKKNRVLLFDTSHVKRDLRAEVLRRLGIDVDCAADIAEARSWWRPALYDLVLISMEKGRGQRDMFCDDLRSAKPPQRLAFLVGQPEYLVDSPNPDEELALENGDKQAAVGFANATFPADPEDSTQRWGILEASRRISSVRSAALARTQAMRNLPTPPRVSIETNRHTDEPG